MRLRITESDANYQETFRNWILSQGLATETENPLEFDFFNGEQALKHYHGLDIPFETFETKYPHVVEWLNQYKGTFSFYLSLKSQLQLKGKLTDPQILSVEKAILRDDARAVQKTTQEFSIKVGEVVILAKWLGKQIAEQAGYARPHFAMEVVEVLGETHAAFHLKLRLSAQKTSYCGCCGLKLTDPQSVAIGIGPICADNAGISHGDLSLTELADKLKVTGEVTSWMPKKAVKRT